MTQHLLAIAESVETLTAKATAILLSDKPASDQLEAISQAVKAFNVAIRKAGNAAGGRRGRWTAPETRLVTALVAEVGPAEAARRMGISRSTLWRSLKS